jgi:hypothetical protein
MGFPDTCEKHVVIPFVSFVVSDIYHPLFHRILRKSFVKPIHGSIIRKRTANGIFAFLPGFPDKINIHHQGQKTKPEIDNEIDHD